MNKPIVVSRAPARPGMSLGWRLALSTALIISLVMGFITISQQVINVGRDREIHETLLRESLAPLAVRLEKAVSRTQMQAYLDEFHAAYEKNGFPVHDLVLREASGRPLLASKNTAVFGKKAGALRAEIPVVSPLFVGGQGSLLVLKDTQGYESEMRRSWYLWLAHFIVTVGAVSLFLAASIYLQVTRPINRLLAAVRKMEMGYWGPIEIGAGAWEIRWLAWRFGNWAQEVRNSMIHLFEAERKARALIGVRESVEVPLDARWRADTDSGPEAPTDLPEYRVLTDVCRRLEAATPGDPSALVLARGVWRKEALEANRFGFHKLKARMENAALSLTDPDGFTRLDRRLDELKASWRSWATRQRARMQQKLTRAAIPCVGVLHRVKHTAGAWTKMRDKGLGLEEVYDLFAFRIIVPTEADCYAALGVIHQLYEPEVSRFKDYIADPKANGYRSLHTCVKAEDGPIFEVQIRSIAMDRQAERGDAAHWLYKKDGREADRISPASTWWSRAWRSLRVWD